MSNRYMKRCSASFNITEMQIKTVMRYHLTPVTMGTVKETRDYNCLQGCEQKEILFGENVNYYSHYEKQYGGSSKN